MMGLKAPRKTLLNDLVAGLVMAVVNVPQAETWLSQNIESEDGSSA